jgi:hypothetical protein
MKFIFYNSHSQQLHDILSNSHRCYMRDKQILSTSPNIRSRANPEKRIRCFAFKSQPRNTKPELLHTQNYEAYGNIAFQQSHSVRAANALLEIGTPLISGVCIWIRRQVSSGGIVSDYGLNDRAIGVRFPAEAKDFSSILCPDRLWGPHILLSNGHRGSYPRR